MNDLITQARAVEARLREGTHVPDMPGFIATLIAELEAPQADAARPSIKLNKAEIQSGVSRVRWAEGLIRQLPEDHDGRNSWLLNYSDTAYQAIVDALEGKTK